MVSDIDFTKHLYHSHKYFRENSLSSKRIKHSDILPLIERLKDKDNFIVNKVGESTEGRSINLIKFGEGKLKVFLWSQMHGDESTATRAIFDIFNFLAAYDDFNPCRRSLHRKLTLYFLPMVNPDGADIYQRENIQNIDINRDAARLQTIESKILFDTFKNLEVDFGFNLHDQDRVYSVGSSNKSAAVSFLAPPFNYNRRVNRVRSNAMKLIVKMDEILSWFIPGHTAKYNDEFEPRAFGDNFQKSGTSTILIESGTWHNDDEKEFIRKLNYIVLLGGFKSISEGSYKKNNIDSYYRIPENNENMIDLIIRKVKYKEFKDCIIDIGINRKEILDKDSDKFYYQSFIEEIGDLSVYHGYEDHDFSDYILHPGKIYPNEFNSFEEIQNLDFDSLYEQGFLFVRLNKTKTNNKFVNVPINVLVKDSDLKTEVIKPDGYSNFYLEKNGRIDYIIINGFLHCLNSKTGHINNGLFIRNN